MSPLLLLRFLAVLPATVQVEVDGFLEGPANFVDCPAAEVDVVAVQVDDLP